MKPTALPLAALILAISFPAWSEVYRHVDENGNVTFSDEPQNGAEAIKVKPVTTVTLPKLQDLPDETRDQDQQDQQQEPQASYQSIQFNAPENNEAFWSGSGDITFSVSSNPPLRQGHKYEVTLDGQIVGQSTDGTVAVQNVFRGTHQAQVSVVDSQGRPVQRGQSISFTIHRPSVLN
ncbi:MAG: DUF4124 domain-containing protein [Marinobacter sp.]|uniref:DUF4124 domain-containing protein n=1 Tax=Marinobacter sp. TaxID=50741 RepID=UPI00299DF94D|nr:DUF4124 domain-containing protein [Marinobacter sp.]MDX1635347.1 DUF4124 domain-containing protein [Marinobacter sp.]